MPDYVVKTIFTAKDHVSDTYDAMGRSADRFGDRAASSFRRASREGKTFGSVFKGVFAANMASKGIDLATQGIKYAGMEFLKFDDIIVGAAASFDDIGPGAKNAAQRIAELGQGARKSIIGTRFAATDAASALNELAKAGYTSDSALGVLPNLMNFATAAQENLAEATSMSSDILGGFGLRSKDTQVQLKNHVALNDELTKASLLATGGLRDLYETLNVTAPLAGEINMSRQELMAFSIVLSNAGIKGGEAATAIKRATTNIYAAGKAAKYGIPIADQSGKLLKFSVVLGSIAAKLKPMSEKARMPIIKDIFGLHGLAGSIKMMRELEQAAKYVQDLQNSAGTSEATAKMQDMSTWAKALMVANAAIEKGFQIIEKFDGSGKNELEVLIKKINDFDVKPVVEGLKAVAATAKILWKILEPFVPYLPQIVATFIAWKGVLFAIGTGKAIFNIIKFVGTNWVAMGDGVSVVAAAFDLFGISLGAVAISAGAVAATIISVNEAIKSYKTGKDNFISRAAQDAGLVPKAITNENGVITGHDYKNFRPAVDKVATALVPAATPMIMAINRLISELRQNAKQQVEVSFNNAPAGTTVNSTGGAPAVMRHMLGMEASLP